ncbi:mkkA [Symbiodinium sp. CCMP2456]|nr:mkkA [Symbiodinium sp. CCMP2456]
MEPLRPANLPPLSVGTTAGSARPSEEAGRRPSKPAAGPEAEAIATAPPGPSELKVPETGPTGPGDSAPSPFECTFGTHGVTQLSPCPGKKSLADMEETLRTGHFTVIKGPSSGRRWIRGESIGRGSLGTVYQAMDQQTGELLAVKEVVINASDSADMKFKDQLENEIQIVKELKHPRIVAYLGHDYMGDSLFIYLEFMAGGSLAQALRQFGCFEESLLLAYTREMLEGLEYLHTRETPVVHRDIKGANVLVDLDCHAKLSDFGCSKRDNDTMSHTMRGSIPWMAPEVIKNTGYGRKADIWSFGCVVIEMATAKSPWGSFDNPMAAMCKIAMSDATPPIPEGVSPACQDFIRLCTRRDPADRPDATRLLAHDILKNVIVEDD